MRSLSLDNVTCKFIAMVVKRYFFERYQSRILPDHFNKSHKAYWLISKTKMFHIFILLLCVCSFASGYNTNWIGERCEYAVLDRNKTANQIAKLFNNSMDIIEIQFQFEDSYANASSDINEVIEAYNAFVYFLTTNKGKSILSYPIYATSFVSFGILSARKVVLPVRLDFAPEHCSYVQYSEEEKKNMTRELAFDLMSTEIGLSDVHMCHHSIPEDFLTFYDKYASWLFPYRTWNGFGTECYSFLFDSESRIEEALAPRIIFIIAGLITVTFPLIVAIFPDTTAEEHLQWNMYYDHDTPYSFRLIWQHIIHFLRFRTNSADDSKKSDGQNIQSPSTISYGQNAQMSTAKSDRQDTQMSTTIRDGFVTPSITTQSGRETFSASSVYFILLFFSFLAIETFTTNVLPSLFSHYHRAILKDPLERPLIEHIYSSSLWSSTLNIAGNAVCAFLIVCIHGRSWLKERFQGKSAIHESLTPTAFKWSERRKMNFLTPSAPYTKGVDVVKSENTLILGLFHYRMLKLFENSFCSYSFWKKVVGISFEFNDENNASKCTNIFKYCMSPIILVLNIIFCIFQSIPLLQVPVQVLIKRDITFLPFSILYSFLILGASSYMLKNIQYFIEIFFYSLIIGVTYYPSSTIPVFALSFSVLRLMLSVWNRFQNDMNILLSQIFALKTSNIDPELRNNLRSHDDNDDENKGVKVLKIFCNEDKQCVKKKDFQYIYENLNFCSFSVLFSKLLFLSLVAAEVIQLAFQIDHNSDLQAMMSAIFVLFSSNLYEGFTGMNDNVLKGQIRSELETFFKQHKELYEVEQQRRLHKSPNDSSDQRQPTTVQSAKISESKPLMDTKDREALYGATSSTSEV